MPSPFFVHLVFHPRSSQARTMAEELYRAWNEDSAIPGLRIPIVFVPEDGSELPPAEYPLDEATQTAVIVLVEDEMVADDLTAAGHLAWSDFVVGLYQTCAVGARRLIPVQLSSNGYPLDNRLANLNFARAHLQPEESRVAWLTRILTIELCRFLDGTSPGHQLPLQLFISHAKADINEEPHIFKAIDEHLEITQPISGWVDSAKIFPGSTFPEQIENGIKDSIVLALETKNYNRRTWCRREVLTAKRFQRPLVLVDALEGMDLRSFPYGGNIPRISWPTQKAREAAELASKPDVDANDLAAAQAAAHAESQKAAESAVNLLLKETLRYRHVKLVLDAQSRAGDVVLPSAPELATISHLPEGTNILYPDPPLGDEEMELFKSRRRNLQTPLQRAAEGRLLKGQRIILSISESGDTELHGMTQAQLDAALDELSRQLLVRGACLEYGGHLGSEGYTVALFEMVRAYSDIRSSSETERELLPEAERVINDVGWPLPLTVETRAKYKLVATFNRLPRPAGVELLDSKEFVENPKFFEADSAKRRYAWARGMTAMREYQARESKAIARVAIGAKFGPKPTWYRGRIPGVVEEALLSLKESQPLYLVGAFGGAAALVIDLLEGKVRDEFTWKYQQAAPFAPEMKEIYLQQSVPWVDYEEMTDYFRDTGVQGLSALNHLTAEQNRELFCCRDVARITELILEGLSKCH